MPIRWLHSFAQPICRHIGMQTHYQPYLYNQGRYRKTDSGIGFRASNRPIHVLGRRPNCGWGLIISGIKKFRNRTRFSPYLHNQGRYGKRDGRVGFRASNIPIHAVGRRPDCRLRCLQVEVEKWRNRGCFCFRIGNQRRYGEMDGTIGFSASNMRIYHL